MCGFIKKLILSLIAGSALLVAGWQANRPKESPPAASEQVSTEQIPGLPLELKIAQRAVRPIRGTKERLRLSVGDITKGSVAVEIRYKNAKAVLPAVDLKQGDSKSFEFEGHRYVISVKELKNSLIGEDFATIVIASAKADEQEKTLTEPEKTERLLATVGSLKDAVFVRNGSDHTPEDAVAHLRRKLKSDTQSQTSAKSFIERLATRSSTTGDAYLIRYADGTTVPAGEFLAKKLQEIEAGESSNAPPEEPAVENPAIPKTTDQSK